MARHIEDSSRQSPLSEQMAAKGLRIRHSYGPTIGWNELLRILQDRACVRYPCEIQFGAGPLLPGELAHAVANGAKPEEGFIIFVHPACANQPTLVPYLILQQLILVDSGGSASVEESELFGSSALGVSREEYSQAMSRLVTQVHPEQGED